MAIFTNIQRESMFKKIIQLINFTFISIILISIILAGWTSYSLVSQSSRSTEITEVIQNIYSHQKSIIIEIIDLSKILVKDTSERITRQKSNVQENEESQTAVKNNYKLDESSTREDNGDNPLGIVIEPSLSEITQEPPMDKEIAISENGIDID